MIWACLEHRPCLIRIADLIFPAWKRNSVCSFIRGAERPTLNSIPDEIEQNSLQKWDITGPHAPTVSILYGEANVPLQTAPRDKRRESRNQQSTNHNDEHRLRYREPHGFAR